jgi:hypothetical protein
MAPGAVQLFRKIGWGADIAKAFQCKMKDDSRLSVSCSTWLGRALYTGGPFVPIRRLEEFYCHIHTILGIVDGLNPTRSRVVRHPPITGHSLI